MSIIGPVQSRYREAVQMFKMMPFRLHALINGVVSDALRNAPEYE